MFGHLMKEDARRQPPNGGNQARLLNLEGIAKEGGTKEPNHHHPCVHTPSTIPSPRNNHQLSSSLPNRHQAKGMHLFGHLFKPWKPFG
ncbi:hypothetical protein V6N11_037107 [Hibiscus sabdariffa]|uniref:Uncharacterized protein n=2 Tax=Hibiscus sabdariffa TaxID=183260 RepID=A0ABR1Z9Y1_9ROSI